MPLITNRITTSMTKRKRRNGTAVSTRRLYG
jgi:hypothetical protein